MRFLDSRSNSQYQVSVLNSKSSSVSDTKSKVSMSSSVKKINKAMFINSGKIQSMKKWEKNLFDPGKIQAAKLGKTNIVWSYQIDRFHSLFLRFQARNDGMTR